LGPQVKLVEAYGPAVTGDVAGYRILLDYWRIFKLIQQLKPDVLEAGDPWLTGLFCLALKKSGLYNGLLASFYHSDPVPSYLDPWASRGSYKYVKRILVSAAGTLFYALQKGYEVTAVSSRTMEASLTKRGVQNLAYLPFGVPARFLGPLPVREKAVVRILYAGRLDREKGIELVLATLSDLLREDNVEVSILGRGSYADHFVAYQHPRFTYLGFLEGQEEVARVYDRHDILMAPGPFETFGLGVLEAMARGMVVVGPDCAGTGEMLREAKSQYIFMRDDLQDFLRALRAAMSGDRAIDSKRARELAQSYGTWDEAVQRMVAYYTAHGMAR
jgi:alpha-1,6-mannosyltransferase